jgi:translation initiation factor 5B
LLVVGPDDDEDELEDEIMADLEGLLKRVSKSRTGVTAVASTLGSLEALLEFLKESKIPVGYVSLGTVFKRDVIQTEMMLERAKEYAIMLCFDVKIDKDAQVYAEAST